MTESHYDFARNSLGKLSLLSPPSTAVSAKTYVYVCQNQFIVGFDKRKNVFAETTVLDGDNSDSFHKFLLQNRSTHSLFSFLPNVEWKTGTIMNQ